MKKLLAVFAVIALSGAFAKADDKGTEFKFGGDIRERFYFDQNPTFANSNGASETDFQQRDMFNINAINGDHLQGYLSLIHTAMWGGASAVPTNPYVQSGAAGSVDTPSLGNAGIQNTVQVYEAWLWWKWNDSWSMKAGRMALDIGDGLVLSKNDWYANPYNFDGLMIRWGLDFADVDFGGTKLGDGGMATTTAGLNDNEIDAYAVNFGFKNLPDFLKKANLTYLLVNGDGATTNAGIAAINQFLPSIAATGGSFTMDTIALNLKGDTGMWDYRLDGAYQFGQQQSVSAPTPATGVSFTGNMLDAQVGATFVDFMKAHVYVGFHRDSGNDSTDATKNNAYQPLFYDKYDYAGLTNFFGFGNLTDIRIGAEVHPSDDSIYGLQLNLASATATGANASVNTVASSGGLNGGQFVGPTQNNQNSSLGTDLGIYGKYTYGHGLSSMISAGMLSLGNHFQPSGAQSPGNAYQVLAQLDYTF